MISTKRHVIVQSVQKSGINYIDVIPRALEDYIKIHYKCTRYLARQAVQDLLEDAKEIKDL